MLWFKWDTVWGPQTFKEWEAVHVDACQELWKEPGSAILEVGGTRGDPWGWNKSEVILMQSAAHREHKGWHCLLIVYLKQTLLKRAPPFSVPATWAPCPSKKMMIHVISCRMVMAVQCWCLMAMGAISLCALSYSPAEWRLPWPEFASLSFVFEAYSSKEQY